MNGVLASDLDGLSRGQMMNGTIVNTLGLKVLELSGTGMSLFKADKSLALLPGGKGLIYVESHTVDEIYDDNPLGSGMTGKQARMLLRYTEASNPQNLDISLCGVVHNSVHWVPFVANYIEHSQSGSVELYVIDSGLHNTRSLTFLWDGAFGVHASPLNVDEPEYTGKLTKLAAWYCYCTRRQHDTLIEVTVRGTGKQLHPNSSQWKETWSSGRWAVANLGILITSSVLGLSTARVAPSLNEVQDAAVKLAELACCSIPSIVMD